MVAVPAVRPSPKLPWPALLAVGCVAVLGLGVLPVAANHVQTGGGGAVSVQFDHDGDNEWWVEVLVNPGPGDFVTTVEARVEGGTWHHLQQKSQHGDWAKWGTNAPHGQFHIPAGKRVEFRANLLDDATDTAAAITSCPFTHPAGVEQCPTSSTTTTTDNHGFDATFTGVRGNEWWVQANVATNGPAVAKVDVREHANGAWGAFQPLAKQNWGPTAWAASYHVPQGTIVQLRATSTQGTTDLSSCQQWVPPSNADAPIVACPGGGSSSSSTTTGPQPFDATFTGVKGNDWWVQANVAANEPLAGVDVRVNCAPQWRPLAKQNWGGWAASFNIPAGSKVDFKARSLDGDSDTSGGYVWPQASPTSGCALGAWPKEGSFARYGFSSGVCGGGECFQSSAVLDLVYRNNQWTGACSGEDRHSMPDGSEERVTWTDRLDGVAPPFQTAKTVGAQVQQKDFDVGYGNPNCVYVVGPVLTVERQETYQTGLPDGNGGYRQDQVWVAVRDVEPDNLHDARWDTDLGMVIQSADYPRRSAQGSNYMALQATDAPLTAAVVVA